jgi:hypothetical protein
VTTAARLCFLCFTCYLLPIIKEFCRYWLGVVPVFTPPLYIPANRTVSGDVFCFNIKFLAIYAKKQQEALERLDKGEVFLTENVN